MLIYVKYFIVLSISRSIRLNYEGTPLELVENSKYLGMSINSDISWDFHAQRLC